MIILRINIISFYESDFNKWVILNLLKYILYILGLLGLNHVPSNVYSAAVAILVLHVALGSFIYRAYFDDQSKTQTKRD